METPKPTKDYSSSVDTSRPFRSVREAVAIFGEKILVGEIYSPEPYYTPPRDQETSPLRFSSTLIEDRQEQNENYGVLGTLKKLEAELEDTKVELKLLKERESETEIALASLNAELHKNMSKLAEAEAAAAKKAAETRSVSFERKKKEDHLLKEEERRRALMVRMENSPTLAQFFSVREENNGYLGRRKVMKKKKPIVPLVADLFFKKKGTSTNNTLNNLSASPQVDFK